MRKLGYAFMSAFAPSVRPASYCAMFFASMANSGFSPANGSGRMPSPGLNPAGGVVSPPL